MKLQSVNKTARRSFKSSQTPRFLISLEKVLGFILMLIFLVCLCFQNRQQTLTQNQHSFPGGQPLNSNNLNASSSQALKSVTTKQQIQKNCINAKCYKGEIQILQLISKLMNDKVTEEYTVPGRRIGLVEGPQLNSDTSLPQKVEKGSDNSFFWQNLVLYKLKAVQNQRLTTPKQPSAGLLSLFTQLFIPNNPYEGINCLFQNIECFWESQTDNAIVTVQSNEKIRPSLIEIESKAHQSSKVQVIGLIMTTSSQLIGVQLGRFSLKEGLNWLQCKRSSCLDQYFMILLKIEKMRLGKLRIYQKLIF